MSPLIASGFEQQSVRGPLRNPIPHPTLAVGVAADDVTKRDAIQGRTSQIEEAA